MQIDVQSDLDVSVAFEFSKRTGVPIVIKNTGVRRIRLSQEVAVLNVLIVQHDYKGRSSAPASLALWVGF